MAKIFAKPKPITNYQTFSFEFMNRTIHVGIYDDKYIKIPSGHYTNFNEPFINREWIIDIPEEIYDELFNHLRNIFGEQAVESYTDILPGPTSEKWYELKTIEITSTKKYFLQLIKDTDPHIARGGNIRKTKIRKKYNLR